MPPAGEPTLNQRRAGVLLPLSSVPGPHGVGELGPATERLLDWLAAAGFAWWQMLPVQPTGRYFAPYSPISLYAGHPLHISVQRLVADGLLRRREVQPKRPLPTQRLDYDRVMAHRDGLLRLAFERFTAAGGPRERAFKQFCRANRSWLEDYVLFVALREAHGGQPWNRWPPALAQRDAAALAAARDAHAGALAYERFVQFVFEQQWQQLRAAAATRGIGLIGDVPLFAHLDSSDVWARPELFQLTRGGQPRAVSGAPPDAFNALGQVWDHPLFDWRAHEREKFAWWVARFEAAFTRFRAVRIDHFLGFDRLWRVPANSRDARRGKWTDSPGSALWDRVSRALGPREIIVEDLGNLRPSLHTLRDRYGFPGMRVLQWGFNDLSADSRYHQPHRYPAHCAVYTGTHDFDTLVGWRRMHEAAAAPGADPEIPRRAARYLGLTVRGRSPRTLDRDMVRGALASPANLAIVPLQDLLGLGPSARINVPGTRDGNWVWRLRPAALTKALAAHYAEWNRLYERTTAALP